MGRAVGAWGVLLSKSNPVHLPESSRDPGDRPTLPLEVLTCKQYMLMERQMKRCVQSVGSGGVMAGLPPEGAGKFILLLNNIF